MSLSFRFIKCSFLTMAVWFSFLLPSEIIAASDKLALLKLESKPVGAEVILRFQGSEIHLGKTPYINSSFISGNELEFEIKKNFYLSEVVRIKLTEGKNNLSVKLKPLFRNLSILTRPEGAVVYLDGKKAGKTPLLVEGLKKNKVILSIHDPLYKDIEDQEIQLYKGKDVLKQYVLTPDYGDVEFFVQPQGANIRILDSKGKVVVSNFFAERIRLRQGEYTFIFKKEGYRDLTINKKVPLKKIIRVPAVLKRMEGLANIMIRTKPFAQNAHVFIDGKKTGLLGELFQISPGKHDVKIVTDTRSFYKTLSLEDDEFRNLILDINLDPPVVVDGYADNLEFNTEKEGFLLITEMDNTRIVKINNIEFSAVEVPNTKSVSSIKRVYSRLKFRLPLGRHSLEIIDRGEVILKKEIDITSEKTLVLSASN